MSFVRQHKGAVLWSVALHVAVVAALSMGIRFPSPQRAAVAMAPIQGVLVDQGMLERETQRREQSTRQEQQRRQREERQKRDAERARTEAEQQERQRVVQQQRDKERAAEQERERVAAEKRRQEQTARDQQQREARERTQREEAAKREREAAVTRRAQQQAESELQQALASEQERQGAERAGLLDQYIAMIENQIERHWNQPLSVRPGLDCIVDVVQLPTGDVMSAKVSSCNGDEAVTRSIERAVMDASPLPKPPNPALFERSLRVRFHPDL